MKNSRIHLSIAHINGKEQAFINEAFESNWLTTLGPQVDAFEKELKTYLHTDKEIVALSSGTAAIHLGLIELGVQPGDEVICPSFTFAASVNPIKYLQANPVFVDSETDTWNISPELLRQTIEDRIHQTGKIPRAIITVDLYGMPAKMMEIMQVANQYGISVLEDSAEALGAYVIVNGEKRYCGTMGRYAVLSFNGNKIITTSGGGALICPGSEEAVHVRFLSTQARDNAPHYQHTQIGYNYRLSSICAAVGRGQLLSLTEYVERRRAINRIYREELGSIPELEFQTEPEGFYSNYWLTSLLFPSYEIREKVRLHLESQNIESRPSWKPMHLQPLYSDVPFYGDMTSESLFYRGLCLPSGSILRDEEIVRVCNSIKEVLI